MERSYDDRQKSDRSSHQPAAASDQQQRGGGARGSASELDKRGRAGLPETSHDDRRHPADYPLSDF